MSLPPKERQRLDARKGARRMAEIPAPVLRALQRGELETKTLVEWLAVDLRVLMTHVLPEAGLAKERGRILRAFAPLESEGISKRMKGLGAILHETLSRHPQKKSVFEKLAAHRSDVVRSLAAYSVGADGSLQLRERLRIAKRFAADGHMGVREAAWDSFRAYLEPQLPQALKLLQPWVRDRDFRVRRCAVEATRPCGVWTAHFETLKADPSSAEALLEPLKADPERYVQASVGNWLNDASKSRPDWVRALCKRWEKQSRCSETKWIVNRALRTLRKGKG